jgi:Nuclease-related domain
MQTILESNPLALAAQANPLLAGAFVVLVLVVVALLVRRRGRSRHLVDREAPRRAGPASKPASGGRRTNLVTDAEWGAFREVKAGITGQKGEAAVARQLALLGAPALHDVILADSRGLTQIDHLVLGLDAIIVIETKTFSGFITGSVHSNEWTQHLAQAATWTTFQNPVRQNHRHCLAALEIVGDLNVLVRGYVVSAGKARFGDALAGVVVPLDRLSEIFIPSDGPRADQSAMRLAWERLVAAAQAGEARRAEHLDGPGKARDGGITTRS